MTDPTNATNVPTVTDVLRTLFVPRGVFDSAFVLWSAVAVAALIVVVLAAGAIMRRRGVLANDTAADLRTRTLTWIFLAPAIAVPILLGPGWTMLAVCALSLACLHEFARGTGLFREKLVTASVVVTILVILAANLDHWPRLFLAAGPLGSALVAMAAMLGDRPKGYLQRTALGIFGLAFCGVGLGYMGMIANDRDYRPIIVLLLLGTQLNDVFAFLVGRTFGRHRFCPNTSPRKTLEGALGAMVLTTLVVVWLGGHVFAGTPLEDWRALAGMGLMLSVLGQLGDLMLSSIKRDIGVKDLGKILPGHGGLLDRFDSLVLATPAYFHLVSYHRGIAVDSPVGVLFGAGAGG